MLFVEDGFAHVFGAQIFPLSHLIFLDQGLNLSLCLSHLNRRDLREKIFLICINFLQFYFFAIRYV